MEGCTKEQQLLLTKTTWLCKRTSKWQACYIFHTHWNNRLCEQIKKRSLFFLPPSFSCPPHPHPTNCLLSVPSLALWPWHILLLSTLTPLHFRFFSQFFSLPLLPYASPNTIFFIIYLFQHAPFPPSTPPNTFSLHHLPLQHPPCPSSTHSNTLPVHHLPLPTSSPSIIWPPPALPQDKWRQLTTGYHLEWSWLFCCWSSLSKTHSSSAPLLYQNRSPCHWTEIRHGHLTQGLFSTIETRSKSDIYKERNQSWIHQIESDLLGWDLLMSDHTWQASGISQDLPVFPRILRYFAVRF